MRLRSAIADLRRQTRNLEIPGSLAQRKIDASINFAARLAPRNDGKLPVPPVDWRHRKLCQFIYADRYQL